MLDNKGFDLWADGYDKSVKLSEESDEYPFAGYKNLLNTIYNEIKTMNTAKVLDIGIGTGTLAKKLYDEGYTIYGVDFSEKMIEYAKGKMPDANLFKSDFSLGLPNELKNVEFDFIICTYAIHHLDDSQKLKLVFELLDRLSPKGKILIGDVAFETKEQLERCRIENLDGWDTDEIYPVFEIFKEKFAQSEFTKISFCSGIISITK